MSTAQLPPAPALFTDRYELTMVAAALADGTAELDCVFEVFARRLPFGRRYGVLAGTGCVFGVVAPRPPFRPPLRRPRRHRPFARGAAALPLRGRRADRPAQAGPHRRAAARLAGRLSVLGRHRRLRRG